VTGLPGRDETCSYARPDELLGLPDLEEIERTVRRAIDERRDDLVEVVGSGEFSLALRWPVDEGEIVVKRVPPFLSSAAAEQYCAATRDYIAAIEAVGVPCVRTELLQLEREDEAAVVYHCQPLLDPQTLVSNILRAGRPDAEHPVVISVVTSVGKVVGPGMAFDGQASNWAWHDGRAWYLDFSTPLLLDGDGGLPYSSDGFDLEYPRFVRGLLAREAQKWLPRYTELEFVLHDLVALLHREGLDAWCEPFAVAIQREVGIPISLPRARKNFRQDARLYPVTHALRKLQRAWLQRTGRRYESLLTPRSSYGLDRRA
jgi:hypothetical protein